jgi:hypothetical protein
MKQSTANCVFASIASASLTAVMFSPNDITLLIGIAALAVTTILLIKTT